MEELFLKTRDNISVAINYFNEGHNQVIIIAPGWCMTKDSKSFSELANAFRKDFDVVSMDFRGHGKSSGFFTFTAKELYDIDAVIEFVKDKYEKIYLLGFSLGGGLVLNYAAQNHGINKVIAVSPYSDFNKIENKMWKKEAWGETFKKFELMRFLSIRPSIIPYKKLKPIDLVENIKSPVLFIAGKKDPTVLPWHTEKLYKKAKCPKAFRLYDNGIHAEDIFLYNRDNFMNTCLSWLKEENAAIQQA